MVPDASSPPAIRARLLWARLRQVERLPPVDRAAILAGLGATTVGRIETAGPLAWLPVETSVAFTEAVFMRLGAKRAQRFFESTLAAMAETALFRPFVQAVVDAVASDVVQGLAWLPKGWALAHRDCGRLRVESRGVGVATIRIVELPSSLAANERWLDSIASTSQAIFALSKTTGAAVVRDVDVAHGAASIQMRWIDARLARVLQ